MTTFLAARSGRDRRHGLTSPTKGRTPMTTTSHDPTRRAAVSAMTCDVTPVVTHAYSPSSSRPRMSVRAGITTLADLREHLQWAIELEHATIPPYLSALYSIDPARNPEVAEVVRSVFVEEMLHLLLAANLLNAVGGRPVSTPPRCLRPTRDRCRMPTVRSRSRCSPSGRSARALLEDRAALGAGRESGERHYETIGQFYDAIEHGMRDLRAPR